METKNQTPDQIAEHLLRVQRDLGIALSATSSLSEVLHLVLEALFQTEEIEGGCIYIFNDAISDIILESIKGCSRRFTEIARSAVLKEDIFSHIQDGSSYYGSFVKNAPLFKGAGADEGFRSFGIIPLVYEEKVLGALSVVSRTLDRIPPLSRFVYETIAARMAGIIHKIHSEDSLKKANAALEDLNAKLKLSEQRYRSVIEDLTDLICRFRPDGKITFVNTAYCSYFGNTKENFEGGSRLLHIAEEDRAKAEKSISSLSRSKPVTTIEYKVTDRNGNIRWIDWTVRAIFSQEGKIEEYQSVGRDVTDKKGFQEKLEFMGMHDSLTGLYNRAFFDEEMKRLSSSRIHLVSIVVCDLNGLKIINDALGHQKGDDLILAAAGVLRQSFRDTDIIARLGGDEFAILLPDTNKQSVLLSIDRIKRGIKEIRERNTDMPLSLATGFAVKDTASVTLDSAFAEADDMMYHEKEIQRDFTRGLVLTTLMHEISKADKYRADHMLRVRDLAMAIGTAAGMNESDMEKLQLASRYHDIGMIGIDTAALKAKDPLSAEEYDSIKRHPEIGARIAEAHPFLRDISDIILKHHEWWNGEGYPKGISGDSIPLLSRIIAVADSFDSMTNNSYYRGVITEQEARDIIRKQSGIQFDPEMATLFLSITP
ncbi:MAG: HD domain-containing phosphohydrolase [Spirochaetota bacterium]